MEDRIQERLEFLKTHVGQGKLISQGRLSRQSGVSEGSVSQIINGKYKGGGIEELIEKMEEVVNRLIAQESTRFREPVFIETTVSRVVWNALDNAYEVAIPRIVVLYGESGIGKTTSIKEWSKHNPSAVIINVRPDFNDTTTIRKIAENLKISTKGTNSIVVDRIVAKLSESGRLLVFDEAEYLSARTLDIIRRIHDEARTPVVLVGLSRLFENLVNLKSSFAQIANRMVPNNVDILSSEDVFNIAQSAFPEASYEVLNSFVEESGCSPRTMILMMQDLVNLESRSKNFKISSKTIRERRQAMH